MTQPPDEELPRSEQPPTPPNLPEGENGGSRGCLIALAIVGGIVLLLGGACFVLFAIA